MENTKKSKKVLKVVTGVSALALVSAISFGATFAYLQANTNTKINTFTGGNVDITVHEDFPDGDVTHSVTYTPGQGFEKKPDITVNVGSESAFLAATVEFKVQNTTGGYDTLTYDQFVANYGTISFGVNDGFNTTNWYRGSDAPDGCAVFYYGSDTDLTKVDKPTTAFSTEDIFDKVTIKQEIGKIDINNTPGDDTDDVYPEIKIIVDGYAVQADNLNESMTAVDKAAKTQLYSLISAAHPATP